MVAEIISGMFRQFFTANLQPRNAMLRDKLSSQALRFNISHDHKMMIFNQLLCGVS
jgi:hypothetical protein